MPSYCSTDISVLELRDSRGVRLTWLLEFLSQDTPGSCQSSSLTHGSEVTVKIPQGKTLQVGCIPALPSGGAAGGSVLPLCQEGAVALFRWDGKASRTGNCEESKRKWDQNARHMFDEQ